MEKRKVNFDTPLNVERLRKLQLLIMNEPLTSEQLTATLKISKPTLSILLKTFGENVYIAGWVAVGNSVVPKYFWGKKEDVLRPSREQMMANSEQPTPVNSSVCESKFKAQSPKRDVSVKMLFGDTKAE